jgi:hypothetical protein
LYRDFDPIRLIMREGPHHRRIVDLTIEGYNQSEIARITGFSLYMIRATTKQPWARERIIAMSKKSMSDKIKEILEKEAIPSLELLVKVRDDTTARNTDRLSASQQLLDRFLGKAAQPIITQEKPPEQLTNDEINARANAILSRFGNTEGAPGAAAD